MPTSILDIEVNDASFQKFAGIYQKHFESVKKLPGMWGEIEGKTDAISEHFAQMTAALLAQQELLAEVNKAERDRNQASQVAEKSMKRISNDSLSVAKNIGSATVSLLKWTGIATVFSGLLGGGGLWGLDKLAGSAGNQLRSARGLGISTGQQQAFGINYGRFVDPNSVLSNVANAKNDWSQRWVFSALGINGVDQKDPTQLSAEAVSRAKSLWDSSDHSLQFAQSRGLTNIFSMDELRRLGNSSPADLAAANAGLTRDSAALGMSPQIQEKWQNFTAQMERAGDKIENVFIKGLIPLEKPLENLSDDFANFIQHFAQNPHIGEWIDDIGKGLQDFATYIESGKLSENVHSFIDDFDALASWVHQRLVNWGIMSGTNAAPSGSGGGGLGSIGPLSFGNGTLSVDGHRLTGDNIFGSGIGVGGLGMIPSDYNFISDNSMPDAGSISGDALAWARKWAAKAGAHQQGIDPQTGQSTAAELAALEKSRGLPPGTLSSTWQIESSSGANKSTSSAGAKGDFQFTDATWKDYGGGGDVNSFRDSSIAAANYYHNLLSQYHGDIRKAAAAYNAGPGTVNDLVKAHGADWEKYASKGVQSYAEKVAAATSVKIDITNATGSNVNTTVSKLAR